MISCTLLKFVHLFIDNDAEKDDISQLEVAYKSHINNNSTCENLNMATDNIWPVEKYGKNGTYLVICDSINMRLKTRNGTYLVICDSINMRIKTRNGTYLVIICDSINMRIKTRNGTYLVICDSINMRIKTSMAGMAAAKHNQTGIDWLMPNGLINHPRF